MGTRTTPAPRACLTHRHTLAPTWAGPQKGGDRGGPPSRDAGDREQSHADPFRDGQRTRDPEMQKDWGGSRETGSGR